MSFKKNVEFNFEYYPAINQWYIVTPNGLYAVKELAICANGVKDLCFAIDNKGTATIQYITGTHKDQILGYPEADIALIIFYEPVPNIGTNMIFEINDSNRHLIEAMYKSAFEIEEQKDYAKYGGDNFGQNYYR